MTARRASRGVRNGIVLAVAVVLVAGAAAYFYLVRSGALTSTDTIDRVVVVFASQAEDGAEVAQVVALVTDGRDVSLIDPQRTASIPGTSYDKLADAYPFGGGGAVAAALDGTGVLPYAYVDVPEVEWVALLQGNAYLRVVVPKPIEVFDGQRLVSFAEGTQTVPAANVPALMRGIAYLDSADRMRVVRAVGEASLYALGAGDEVEVEAEGVRTDLTPDAYARLLASLRAR